MLQLTLKNIDNQNIPLHKIKEFILSGQAIELSLTSSEDEFTIDASPSTTLEEKMAQVRELYEEFHFSNPYIINLIEVLLLKSIENDKYGLNITSSGVEQIVLYTEKEPGSFSNLAIDEDGDISYMYFAKNKKNSERKLFYNDEGLDIEHLVSLL